MASCSPVEAPDGTAARPNAPEASLTSTSTVGLPRESMISRAVTDAMDVFMEGEKMGTGIPIRGERRPRGKAKLRLPSKRRACPADPAQQAGDGAERLGPRGLR